MACEPNIFVFKFVFKLQRGRGAAIVVLRTVPYGRAERIFTCPLSVGHENLSSSNDPMRRC